jgi:hypothetical protein
MKDLMFYGGDYEECHLLICYTVWLLQQPKFRRKVSLHYQGDKNR